MKREIVCPSCYAKRGTTHPEDAALGFTHRVVIGRASKPDDHNVKIYAGDKLDSMSLVETINCETLVCDHCNDPVMDGQEAVAITTWQPEREGTPGNWEKEYLR